MPPDLSLAEHVCLALIAEEPRHGWAIVKQLEPTAELGRIWSLSRALTYRTIDLLESKALIERRAGDAVLGPNRVELVPTPEGLALAGRWLDEPVRHVRDLRTEFVMKVTLRKRRGADLVPLLDAQEAALVPILEALAADRTDVSAIGLWRRESARAAHRFLAELRAGLLDPSRSPAEGGPTPTTDPDAGLDLDGPHLALARLALALPDGSDAVVARTIELRGFGSERPGEVALVAEGELHGRLLGGALDERLRHEAATLVASDRSSTVVGCSIGGAAATTFGLTCGGTASVLLQRLDTLPRLFWPDGLGVPRVTFTRIAGPDHGATLTITQLGQREGTLGEDAADERAVELAGGQMRWGKGGTALLDDPGGQLVMDVSWASRRLLVVGLGDLSDAICRLAAGLGWAAVATGSAHEAVAYLDAATPSDAVVVLSHDPAVDVPVLLSALGSDAGYVGALGSRATQGSRRDRLRNAGAGDEQLGRLHGPAGLDLGAAGPSEIAISIVAEIIATRTGRDAHPLSATDGPINSRFRTT